MLRKIASIATLGVLVSGCTRYVDTYCTNYTPITYSARDDMPETVRQIQESNAVWKSLCKSSYPRIAP